MDDLANARRIEVRQLWRRQLKHVHEKLDHHRDAALTTTDGKIGAVPIFSERLAADAELKESLQNQAIAYRKLAEKRAGKIKLPPVNLPSVTPNDGEQP